MDNVEEDRVPQDENRDPKSNKEEPAPTRNNKAERAESKKNKKNRRDRENREMSTAIVSKKVEGEREVENTAGPKTSKVAINRRNKKLDKDGTGTQQCALSTLLSLLGAVSLTYLNTLKEGFTPIFSATQKSVSP